MGRENKFKYIFTRVYWGEKINLNIFSLLFIGEENIFKFIFATVFFGKKFKLVNTIVNTYLKTFVIGRCKTIISNVKKKYGLILSNINVEKYC